MKMLLFVIVLFQASQALPGIPPFECDGCPPPAASLVASAQALPGLPPFECDGCCDTPIHCCDATHCW